MTTETETPAWIAPGTPVLVIAGSPDGHDLTSTTIEKVYKRYFTVVHHIYNGMRFSLDRQKVRSACTWYMDPLVVPVDSDRARELLDVERRRALVNRARMLARDWQRDPSRDNRLAVIAALQAIEDED